MGPKPDRLAHAQSAHRRLAALALALAALVSPAAAAATSTVERVHRVQIDVSVIDPRGDARASVPHLPRDAFEIRIDGSPLAPDLLARTEFDEICGLGRDGGRAAGPLLPDRRPTLVVLADLNFLDTRARHAVARAIEDLAERAEKEPLRVKVLAFTRRLVSLTPAFTTDPQTLRQAAQDLLAITAVGPPLTGIPGAASADAPTDRSLPLGLSGDESRPPDPDRVRSAFTLASPDVPLPGGLRQFEIVEPVSPERELAERTDFDPRPSLAALEAVLLAHADAPGRKALVLFTSAWFDLSDRLWLSEMSDTLLAAQNGFTIWAVDSRGLAAASRRSTGLLGQLASASGGETVHSAGRLSIAFDRALRQLSCYYLFSVPVEPPSRGSAHHSVSVRLDTQKYPEFWPYRVKSPNGFTLLSREKRRQRERLAALMQPDAHRFPEVRVNAAYPGGRHWSMPVEVSVLLSDLAFVPSGEGGLEARFSWEGVVRDLEGRIRCRLGDGRLRRIGVSSPPSRHPPTMLIIKTSCPLGGPGLFEARVVVEDLTTGDVGAGTVFIDIPQPNERLRRVSPIRLGVASGRDFLLALNKGSADVRRDRGRRAFVPLSRDRQVLTDDRLIARFVSCDDRTPPRAVLYRRTPGPERTVEVLFQLLVVPREEAGDRGTRCREYEALVPERTLAPAAYGIALIDRGARPPSREALESMLVRHEAAALAEFEVIRPAATPRPEGKRTSAANGVSDRPVGVIPCRRTAAAAARGPVGAVF